MAFISSESIKVFPCGGRNDVHDPLARLTTEYNLVSIINRLVDKDSFIVSTYASKHDISNESNPYIINIGGYLFTISSGAKGIIESLGDPSNGTYIIARINPQSYGDHIYQQLSPMESINYSEEKYEKIESEYAYSQDDFTSKTNGSISFYQYNADTEYYIRLDNGKYYRCNEKGEFIYKLKDYTSSCLDDNSTKTSTFKGISFEQSKEAISGVNVLTLFEYDGNGWVEYEDSKIKFSTDILGNRSVTIDDGVI